jgi:hypothetical protein
VLTDAAFGNLEFHLNRYASRIQAEARAALTSRLPAWARTAAC